MRRIESEPRTPGIAPKRDGRTCGTLSDVKQNDSQAETSRCSACCRDELSSRNGLACRKGRRKKNLKVVYEPRLKHRMAVRRARCHRLVSRRSQSACQARRGIARN